MPSSALTRLLASVFLTLCAFSTTPVAEAQVLTILHNFSDGSTGGDGYNPSCAPVLASDGNFYGLETNGGNAGKLYRATPAGVTTILHHFDGSIANEGYFPLSLSLGTDGNLYGVTFTGGAYNRGVIFKMTLQGVYSLVYHFGSIAGDGSNPNGVIQTTDGKLYSTTYYGGANDKGTVVQITPGTGAKVLHTFGAGQDGAYPQANLTQGPDGALYSTTTGGGTGNGTVFKVSTDGATYQVVHVFGSVSWDGYGPPSTLVLASDGYFYGTTQFGGQHDAGIAYKMSPSGNYTILYDFSTGSGAYTGINPGHPYEVLSNSVNLMVAADGNFYGVTRTSKPFGTGTLYKMTPQGVVTFLHNFGDGTVASDGKDVYHAPVQGPDGNLYGVTYYGGTVSGGTFYKLALGLSSISLPPSPAGVVGKPFNFQVAASYQPSRYTATSLPGGLSYNTNTGVISGIPTTVGATTASLVLTNAAGSSTLRLPLPITAAAVPTLPSTGSGPLTATAQINKPFSYAIVASNYPKTYLASPLPPGLSLNATTGVISGTPTVLGTTTISIAASNSAGTGPGSGLNLTVAADPATLGQSFIPLSSFPNSQITGGTPAGLLLPCFDGSLMGINALSGSGNLGTVFQLNPSGGDVTLVHAFGALPNDGAEGTLPPSPIQPRASLLQGSDGNFYGTTYAGGTAGKGTIFKMTPAGVVTVLHNFLGWSGEINNAYHPSELIQGSDGNFYGVIGEEISSDWDFYRITPEGAYTVLFHSQNGTAYPQGLIQGTDGNFYGTLLAGGQYSSGAAFKLTPTGLFTLIASFPVDTVANIAIHPKGNLIQASDGNFYGILAQNDLGTLYRLTPSGTVTILYRFADNAMPNGKLLQGFDGLLYGTTQGSGGTAFQATLAGTVTILHSFGSEPLGPPIDGLTQGSDGNFYGTTGNSGPSSVFAFRAQQKPTLAPVVVGPTTANLGLRTPSTFRLLIKGAATSWSVTGTLPPGTTLNTTTGVISGNPTTVGSYPLTVKATNAIGSVSTGVTLKVLDLPAITSPKVVTINTVGQAFSYQIVATNGPVRFGASNLPPWMSFNIATGLLSGTPPGEGTWTIYPTATNFVGTGQIPVVITVAKLAQTINFPAIAAKSVSDAPFVLSGSSSSGLPLKYKIAAGPATLSGNTVTLTGQTGVVSIVASQAGNSTYLAATSIRQNFAVTKPQSVTFPAIATKTYGTNFTPTATASSGLAITYSVVSGPATISGTKVTITSGVGTVILKATQAGDAAYAPASATQSFAVAKATQTITLPAIVSKPYGTPFAPGATSSSGLPVSYTVVSGPATVSGASLNFTGVGTVALRVDQAGNNNYTAATAVNASFSVIQAAQTITFPTVPAQVVTGGPITLKATASSGLAVTYKVEGPATLSGNVLTLTGAEGAVVVSANQKGNSGYAAAPVVRIRITVTKVAQTISFPALGAVKPGQTVTLAATASSGLPVTYTVTSGTATIASGKATFPVAGTVKLTAAQVGNTTYAAAPSVTITVTVK